MTAIAWQNLALAAFAAFYVIEIGLDIAWGNIFGNLGIDFASFWSAGTIANHYGYAGVYDLTLMQQVQQSLLPRTAGASALANVIPTPYFPVFILPFQVLALVPPVAAFWIWTLLNASLYVWYIRFFIEKTTGQHLARRVLVLASLSVPVFLTLFDGQVNVLLAIFIGEYLRATMEGREVRAGLWLGGLLLKPQCLIILVPALLLQRSIRAIAGLAISSGIILGGSLILGGIGAIDALARLWLGYAGGLPTNDLQLMMNWRMVGLQVSRVAPESIATGVTVAGSVATLVAALYIWRRRLAPTSPEYAIALMGTLAATAAVAWHSHVHMAMLLLPSLVYLHLTQENVFRGKLALWVCVPAGLYCLRLLLAALVRATTLPPDTLATIDSLAGAGLFVLNLYLLGWAIRHTRLSPGYAGTAASATS